MNVLDLFSGLGGFSLGLTRAGLRTAAFCEIDPYCRAVLAERWPGVPIHGDVRKLDGRTYRGTVDVICGGYPCQPFSMAGQRRGAEDERHLWPEMHRLIREVRPRWLVAENVAGHISLGFDEVAASLEAEGFAVWPFVIPACAVGALHRRDRLWLVAHASGAGKLREAGELPETQRRPHGAVSRQPVGASAVADACGAGLYQRRLAGDAEGEMPEPRGMGGDGLPGGNVPETEIVADAERQRLPGSRQHESAGHPAPRHAGQAAEFEHGGLADQWAVEPAVGRVAHGIPHRVERLRALGNAIVPQIAELIGRAILAYESSHE